MKLATDLLGKVITKVDRRHGHPMRSAIVRAIYLDNSHVPIFLVELIDRNGDGPGDLDVWRLFGGYDDEDCATSTTKHTYEGEKRAAALTLGSAEDVLKKAIAYYESLNSDERSGLTALGDLIVTLHAHMQAKPPRSP